MLIAELDKPIGKGNCISDRSAKDDLGGGNVAIRIRCVTHLHHGTKKPVGIKRTRWAGVGTKETFCRLHGYLRSTIRLWVVGGRQSVGNAPTRRKSSVALAMNSGPPSLDISSGTPKRIVTAPSQPPVSVIPSAPPSTPFEKVFADFFDCAGQHYLVVGDRLSAWCDVFTSPHGSPQSGVER